ncbi:MAG TPA: glycosyltransferase family 9 protein [Gemmatimonadaceae bacterium]|nr:glycosyltransferase family 9 protein [Gemmatimonadaceae bacterium]
MTARSVQPADAHRHDLSALPLRRVGIVMLSAVGDAVHVLPVVNALKRAHPSVRISWVMQPGPAALVAGHPAVDEIIPFERRRGWRGFMDVRRALRVREFDLVLALQDYFKAGLIATFAHTGVTLGLDRGRARDLTWLLTSHHVPPHSPQHVQDEYLEFLAPLGIPAEPLEWHLGPWPDERAWQAQFTSAIDRPIAALVVGSSRPEKDWLAERWAALADALYVDYGLQPVLVGGRSPREAATERTVLHRSGAHARSALDSGLRRLVSILDASALVISLDTGPLHMAVALGRPVISLLGYSNPMRTGPYHAYHDLMVNAYGGMWNGATLATDRRPGRMARIEVQGVIERVDRWHQRYRE